MPPPCGAAITTCVARSHAVIEYETAGSAACSAAKFLYLRRNARHEIRLRDERAGHHRNRLLHRPRNSCARLPDTRWVVAALFDGSGYHEARTGLATRGPLQQRRRKDASLLPTDCH